MSITDELRKYVQSWRETPNLMDELDAGDIDGLLGDFIAIADRIDAEHQKAIRELNNLAEASVLLPVDADGEPIRFGDKVTVSWSEKVYEVSGFSYTQQPASGERTIWVDVYSLEKMGNIPLCGANSCHHYHAPTVEDVLREVVTLCHNTWNEDSAHRFYDVDDLMESGNIADFAAKLKLRGDAE